MRRYNILFALLLLLTLIYGADMYAQTDWYNPLEDSSLPVQGRCWNEETGKNYARLPLRAKGNVRSPLWNLSRHSAGIYLKFYTDAPEILVKYKVSGALAMPHMPATGVSGVDLYSSDADGNRKWCAGQYSFGDTVRYSYKNLTCRNHHSQGNEYCLYLPLYNSVEFLQIGVPKGSKLAFEAPSREKPIVVYGTSIAQGACASRPGMAWTNIVQRRLDVPVVNLGFSGNGQLDEDFVALLAECDAALFVIDCMPNLTDQRVEWVKERTMKTVRQLRSQSQAPILLVEHDGYMGYHASEKLKEDFTAPNRQLREAYEVLNTEVPDLHYMTFEELALDMDSQVDGVHATDLGMQQYANAYCRKIKDILWPALSKEPFTPCRQHREADYYRWNKRHEEVLAYNAEFKPEVVMLGNSITHYWGGFPLAKTRRADGAWQKLFKGKRVVNMGFGWDRLENMLWRVMHGELDGFQAESIFMMMGTNNLQQNSDAEIVEGICQVLAMVRDKQPGARLHVVKILPRRGFEVRLNNLNDLLDARLKNEPGVRVIDLTSLLLRKDGTLKEELFLDGLHPNRKGYEVIAEVLARFF